LRSKSWSWCGFKYNNASTISRVRQQIISSVLLRITDVIINLLSGVIVRKCATCGVDIHIKVNQSGGKPHHVIDKFNIQVVIKCWRCLRGEFQLVNSLFITCNIAAVPSWCIEKRNAYNYQNNHQNQILLNLVLYFLTHSCLIWNFNRTLTFTKIRKTLVISWPRVLKLSEITLKPSKILKILCLVSYFSFWIILNLMVWFYDTILIIF